MGKLFYRLNQFRRAHRDQPGGEGLDRARNILSPALFELFISLLPFEQAHSIRVMDKLVSEGYVEPDLLAAALLHDVGKARYPLRPWQRGLAVLAKHFSPGLFMRWSHGDLSGFRAGMVVAAQHAAWGAEMAEAAGANPRVVWLIGHHDVEPAQLSCPDADLLDALKRADGLS